jgi:hypothetical protein
MNPTSKQNIPSKSHLIYYQMQSHDNIMHKSGLEDEHLILRNNYQIRNNQCIDIFWTVRQKSFILISVTMLNTTDMLITYRSNKPILIFRQLFRTAKLSENMCSRWMLFIYIFSFLVLISTDHNIFDPAKTHPGAKIDYLTIRLMLNCKWQIRIWEYWNECTAKQNMLPSGN